MSAGRDLKPGNDGKWTDCTGIEHQRPGSRDVTSIRVDRFIRFEWGAFSIAFVVVVVVVRIKWTKQSENDSVSRVTVGGGGGGGGGGGRGTEVWLWPQPFIYEIHFPARVCLIHPIATRKPISPDRHWPLNADDVSRSSLSAMEALKRAEFKRLVEESRVKR